MKNEVQIFDRRQVRSIWDEENEKWWFSVLDIIGILTDQPDYAKVRNYWKWLNVQTAPRCPPWPEQIAPLHRSKMPPYTDVNCPPDF